MSDDSWFSRCHSAISKTPESLKITTYSFGITVVVCLVVCSVISGAMFWRWRRLDEPVRKIIWKLYGWFTGLMCVGCCIGAVSHASWMLFLLNYYASSYPKDFKSNFDSPEVNAANFSQARALRWIIVFWLTYPVTSGCLTISKLLVLHRLMDFNTLTSTGAPSNRVTVRRIVIGVVAAGSVVGLCANISASVFLFRASDLYYSAAVTNTSRQNDISKANGERYSGQLAGSVWLLFEATMLLLIIVWLSIAGGTSIRRIRQALLSTNQLLSKLKDHSQQAEQQIAVAIGSNNSIRQLLHQILGTCIVVFVAFSLRAIYVFMFTVAGFMNNSNIQCSNYTNRCSACYNSFTFMNVWLLYTPEFYFVVIFVSQPISLMVALWGMTSGSTLAAMKGGQQVLTGDAEANG